MFNPLNLNAAFGLTKIQEEYLSSTKQISRPIEEKGSLRAIKGRSSSWGQMDKGDRKPRKFNP